MRRRLAGGVIVLCTLVCGLRIARSSFERGGKITLPSSKLLLEPVPGNPQQTNSFPVAMALSPDGKYLAILNDGYGTFESDYRQSIAVLDLATNQITDFPDARLQRKAHQTYFYGLAFDSDGSSLYASMSSETDPAGKNEGDTGSGIAVYHFFEGKVAAQSFIRIRPLQPLPRRAWDEGASAAQPQQVRAFPAGIAVRRSGPHEQLLVADDLEDQALLLDSESGAIVGRFDLRDNHEMSLTPMGTPGGVPRAPNPALYPLSAITNRKGDIGYVSLWNDSRVAELDLSHNTVKRSFVLKRAKRSTDPGSHPTTLLLSPDEKRLYVALANRDQVAIVNLHNGKASYLSTKLPGQKYGGSVPIALSITPDGKRLFVANASSDAIAVFDNPHSGRKPRGFIPTEWYPTALAIANGELFIASGKGQGTGPNKGLTGKVDGRERTNFIATLLHGSVARIRLDDIDSHLEEWTEQVMAGNLMRGNSDQVVFKSGNNPIKHVIYIIKENRAYDQVLGDLGVGDGDPSLTMFGENITPNEHKLARQFGVLDNFYDSGEVSGDGHVWSTAAITSDYTEQTWQIAYRGKERTYDFQGMVDDRYPMQEKIPDIDEPSTGYLWGNMARHHVSYRHYGEFISTRYCVEDEPSMAAPPLPSSAACQRKSIKQGEPLPDYLGQPHGSPSPWPWEIPMIAGNIPTKPELVGHFDPKFPDFNLKVPDQLRADEFLNEFDRFMLARARGSDVMPQFIVLYLPDDHTSGTRPGSATPAAAVADNDLALGRVVEAVSHSPYWDDTAIFMVEDDAQNGADHVDAHRSTAWVISRFSPGSWQQPFVDHTFYTTVNMVHTMESLLGVPPMNNNDAHAAVMAPMLSGKGDQPPFTADTSNRDNGLIYRMNPAQGLDAVASSKLDFSREDAIDPGTLNAILWRNRKGSQPLPATPGAEFR